MQSDKNINKNFNIIVHEYFIDYMKQEFATVIKIMQTLRHPIFCIAADYMYFLSSNIKW